MLTTRDPLQDLKAEEVMSRDILTLPVRASLWEAAALLRGAQITGAPVVDEQGRCVGVLSAVDVMHWVEEGSPGAAPRLIRTCPYQTEGRLLTGEEALICTLAWGSCPWQEMRPLTGGRCAEVCLRPPDVAPDRQRVIEELPGDAVGRFMTTAVVTVGPQTPLPELARIMANAHIHRVAVVDEQSRPVGIISSTDILAAVARGGSS